MTTSMISTSGKATFYGGNTVGGACSFTGYQIPAGMSGTAFSGQIWNYGAQCGSCLSVNGPKGSVRVMVTDKCPECTGTHLDLYQDAFSSVGSPSAGIIPISFNVIPCGITSPLIVRTKSGSSKYWFSMQVINANIAVSKLDVSTDGGNTWQATVRKDYNYFEKSSGFGTDIVDVRVTAADGRMIVVKGASVASERSKAANSNFA